MLEVKERKEKNGFIVLMMLLQVFSKQFQISMFFDNLFLVMFIISLSDYNQNLYEDETTNRMQESEKLFGKFLFFQSR